MKKLIIPLLAVLLFSFTHSTAKLTKEERKFAAKELKQSKKLLLKTVKGLSPAQLNYKPSPEVWSIAEIAEHLAISENMFDGMLQQLMQAPASPEKASDMEDEKVLAVIKSREQKVKTQQPFEPTGKYGSIDKTLKAFSDKRDEHIKYINTTDDDLRSHFQEFPFGTVDAYQVILFMSGHVDRHVAQMRELMDEPGFPTS